MNGAAVSTGGPQISALSVTQITPIETEGLRPLASAALLSTLAQAQYVCVGDVIDTTDQDGFLRGHGTQVLNGQLVATVCGLVQRVNKLVSVRALTSRYRAELGDVVVGRVTEVASKRWKVDLSARQEASLLLSAVNLPGGVQRRRTQEDELNMRAVFAEGDLISAEVQSIHQSDGSVNLHTRSLKYGKLLHASAALFPSRAMLLTTGQAVQVAPSLIRRQKQHFNSLQHIGVDIILGCNGVVWVAPHRPVPKKAETGSQHHLLTSQLAAAQTEQSQPVSTEQRLSISRVANSVRALAMLGFPITPGLITDVHRASVEGGVAAFDMLSASFLQVIIKLEAQRRAGD